MEAVLFKHFCVLPKRSASCINVKGSSVKINVNELSLPSEITYKMGHFTLEGWKWKQYFLSASASCQKGPFWAENIKGSSV